MIKQVACIPVHDGNILGRARLDMHKVDSSKTRGLQLKDFLFLLYVLHMHKGTGTEFVQYTDTDEEV